LAGPFVKAKHSLLGLGTHELGVGEIDPALGNDRTRPSWPDWNTPANLQPFGRKRFHNSGFGPDAISVWTSPLWPIVGTHPKRRRTKQKEHSQRMKTFRHGTMPSFAYLARIGQTSFLTPRRTERVGPAPSCRPASFQWPMSPFVCLGQDELLVVP